MPTQLVHSADLEVAVLTQMLLLQSNAHAYPLPAWLSADLADYAVDPVTAEVLVALGQDGRVPILEWLAQGSVAQFKVANFAQYLPPQPAAARVSVWLGAELLAPSAEPAALYSQLQAAGSTLPAVIVQYLLTNGETFLAHLQQLMIAVATRVPAASLAEAEAAAKVFCAAHAQAAATQEPLELAEQLMGKHFHHRGPYQEYALMPTFFGVTMRLFDRRHLLLVHVPVAPTDPAALMDMWKALADPTRHAILQHLAASGPTNAVTLVAAMQLSAPTISHHLEVLRQVGLIHVEPAGRAKYYSVNRRAIQQLQVALDTLLREPPVTP